MCKSLEVDKRSAFRRNAAPRWREGRGTPAHGEAIPRPRPTPRAGRYGAASAERDCGSAGEGGRQRVRCLLSSVNCDESHQSTPASCSWAICRGRIGAPCLLGRARHCSARLFPSFPLLPLSRRRERLSARRTSARRRAGSSTRLRRLFAAGAEELHLQSPRLRSQIRRERSVTLTMWTECVMPSRGCSVMPEAPAVDG